MLPFSHADFLQVFAAYNQAVWPAQWAAYGLAAAICAAIAWRQGLAGPLAGWGLAALWIFTGIVYHGVFFARINPAALLFGAAFVLQGGLLALAASRGLQLRVPRPASRIAGWGLIAYAMLLYPALGALLGVHYPAAPVFGLTPCPLTLFTFGVLLLMARPPGWLLGIPVLWSLVGATAAWQLGMLADAALPLGALAALALRRR